MTRFLDELAIALTEPSCRAHRRWLRRRARCPLLGCCSVRDEGDYYCPDPEGSPAFIFPVLSGSHICANHTRTAPFPRNLVGAYVPLVDLAAWRPSTSDKIRLRVGAVAALGEWSFSTLGDDELPLQLWSTPIAWAAADFNGAVIIDWRHAAPALLNRREIICDTVQLGERVEAELLRLRDRLTPKMPDLFVEAPAPEIAAANG